LTRQSGGWHNARMSQPAKKSPRRWFQFSLRTLLVLTALAAGAALLWRAYLEPYRKQRQTMALIEKLGRRYQTAEASVWLRRILGGDLRNIVLADLADCDDPAQYLQQISSLPAIETLAVGGPAFGDEHLRRLHGLKTLRGLVLDTTSVTDAGLASLRSALPQVVICRGQRRAIAALGKHGDVGTQLSSSCVELRNLLGDDLFFEAVSFAVGFHDNPGFSDAQLVHLRWLGQLQKLSLQHTRVSDAGLVHLKYVRQLQELGLWETAVTDAGLAHVVQLSQLQELNLGGTKVTDAGIAQLKGMKQLQRIYLWQTQVTDAAMADIRELPQLEHLSVGTTQVGDAGVAHLKRHPTLKWLDIHETQVTDASLAVLKSLSQLESLHLEDTRVTDAGLGHLKGLSKLKDLRLEGTKVTPAGVTELRRALPRCEIKAEREPGAP
jgi:Leucine-rich repeat (LRR) protein